jgi:hypothetical protein
MADIVEIDIDIEAGDEADMVMETPALDSLLQLEDILGVHTIPNMNDKNVMINGKCCPYRSSRNRLCFALAHWFVDQDKRRKNPTIPEYDHRLVSWLYNPAEVQFSPDQMEHTVKIVLCDINEALMLACKSKEGNVVLTMDDLATRQMVSNYIESLLHPE